MNKLFLPFLFFLLAGSNVLAQNKQDIAKPRTPKSEHKKTPELISFRYTKGDDDDGVYVSMIPVFDGIEIGKDFTKDFFLSTKHKMVLKKGDTTVFATKYQRELHFIGNKLVSVIDSLKDNEDAFNKSFIIGISEYPTARGGYGIEQNPVVADILANFVSRNYPFANKNLTINIEKNKAIIKYIFPNHNGNLYSMTLHTVEYNNIQGNELIQLIHLPIDYVEYSFK